MARKASARMAITVFIICSLGASTNLQHFARRSLLYVKSGLHSILQTAIPLQDFPTIKYFAGLQLEAARTAWPRGSLNKIEEQIMPDKPENSALKLLSSRKTLVMATADKNGAPNVSYAPFVHRTPRLYVYTSSRSRHTTNMMETAKASVIFIEDE